MTDERGFTIVEVLIATLIMMVIVGATFMLLNPAQGMFAVQPEVSDMQQRLRVAIDMIAKDVMMAGAGISSGPMTGPLGHTLAAVLPYRVGATGADSSDEYFSDRISVLYVPGSVGQTKTGDPVASTVPAVTVTNEPGCPIGNAACGIDKGMAVLIMDESGAWDAFTVADVQGAALQLQHRGPQLSKVYDAGAVLSQLSMVTYWLKTDPLTQTDQLMRYDGNRSDLPIADNVVGLAFEYFAAPPPGAPDPELVKLPKTELTDGPWRPDGVSPGHYDADLLRVRSVRVTLRVQIANRSYRGAAGPFFVHGGTSNGGERYVPDQEITFDVAPRNLGR